MMFQKIRLLLPILIVSVVCLAIFISPIAMDYGMLYPTQFGQQFFLVFVSLILLLLIIGTMLISFRSSVYHFSLIDISIIACFFYVFTSTYFVRGDVSLTLITLASLLTVYTAVRFCANEHRKYLFICLILAGFVQAILGHFQLLGFIKSNHPSFKLTGTFFNPSPFAGYLTLVFTVIMGVYSFPTKFLSTRKIFHTIIQIILFLVISALSASHSRSSWLACIIVILFVVYQKNLDKIMRWKIDKKVYLLFAMFIAGCFLILFLYNFKKNSSDGRILIWEASMKMIKEKPWFGHGLEAFGSNYMHYQEKFLAEKHSTYYDQIADDVDFPYNEALRILAEFGVIGFLGSIFVLVSIFSNRMKKINSEENRIEINVLRLVVLSFVIFSFSSYTLHIWPIMLVLMVLLALISNHFKSCVSLGQGTKIVKYPLAAIVILGLVSYVYVGTKKAFYYRQSYYSWKVANDLFNRGLYGESIIWYRNTYLELRSSNGLFLNHYGKALLLNGNYREAIGVLNQALQRTGSSSVYISLGDCYRQTGKYKMAVQAYQKAIKMVPSKFYPYYLLSQLYVSIGDRVKAEEVSRQILRKEVKVPSQAIEEIRLAAKHILKIK